MAQCRALCCFAGMLLVFSMAAAAAAYTPTQDPAAVQISPSVLVMGEYDWTLYTGSDGKPWSRCLDMVWRARKYSNGNRLNFVPTHHWLPRSDGFGVSSYCYMHTSGNGDKGTCMAWTADKLAEFKKSMTYCFTEAFKQGFIPYVRPHLDDGLNRGVWRNSLLFSPTIKYGDYSYADVMTVPLAEAMRDALAAAAKLGKLVTPPDRSRPVIYMALQGEMSATVMRYTTAWATLIPTVKSTVGSTYADVMVGIGLNFNALDAIETQTNSQTGSGLIGILLGSSSSTTSTSTAPSIDASGVYNLLSSQLDFLGISAYSPYSSASFATSEFQNAAFNVGDSLATLANGLKLYSLASAGQLELHYSEFGIGGGVNGQQQIAPSADACAKQPWAGITGSYSTSMDPWQRDYLAAFRGSFYDKAMDWFSRPGSGTYLVKEVFVWGMASWDLFATYPDSSSRAGSYRDINIVRKIALYNTAVIAAQVCKYKGTADCSAFAKNNSACLNDQSGTACLDRSAPTNPDIVTESGPPQTSGDVSPSPAPSMDNLSPAPGSATPDSESPGGSTGEDDMESAPANTTYVQMSPGSASASSPEAASASSNIAASGSSSTTTSTTKNAASSNRLLTVAAFVMPMTCTVLFMI